MEGVQGISWKQEKSGCGEVKVVSFPPAVSGTQKQLGTQQYPILYLGYGEKGAL